MNAKPKTFYITTAIDYPNSSPHMGHAYEKVVADFYARAYRSCGYDTRFLIGLDEHGQKIQAAAEAAGKAPQEFVDEKAVVFRDLYRLLNISNDDFIRTSERRHRSFCQELFQRVDAKGDIYKGHYEGEYCISCERYYTESELNDGLCPVHEQPVTTVKEESYFFKLGKFREQLLHHLTSNPNFVQPQERRNEVVARLKDDVRDLSISRSTFDWGVTLPTDPSHVLYVWFDALSNYISALTAPNDVFDRYWPADCHVIGKDINWFHSVIWPSMLLSAGYPLPRQVYVHGFILDKDGRKMAKQLGNVVDPLEVVEEYSVDVLRFYFLRCFASGHDGKFSIDELRDRYNSELANELGNLVLRIVKLVTTRLGGEIETSGRPLELDDTAMIEQFMTHVDAREHHRAVDVLWNYIKRTNAYLNEQEPWKLKDEKPLTRVLATGLEALRTICELLVPVMPNSATQIAAAIGAEVRGLEDRQTQPAKYRVTLGEPLFPRRDDKADKTDAGSAPKKAKSDAKKEAKKKGGGAPPATDPFGKLELRVGVIKDVRPHPDADALYALRVDLGEETERSICAGLREYVSQEELEDRRVLVVANLKPAKLRGIESRGMILAADTPDGRVVPVNPGEAPVGDLISVEAIETRPKKKLSKSDFEKAPLLVKDGRVIYGDQVLRSSTGYITCEAEDGSTVR